MERAVTAATGVVLLNAVQDRAVFLTGADLATVRETLDVIVAQPTVAGGPLDAIGLERLARAVELAEEDNAPTVLSEVEEAGLELIKDQAAIRTNLPLRIRRTCRECGHEQIVNPARQARTGPPPSNGSNPGIDTVATSMDLLTEGHPFLATLALFSGESTAGGTPATSETPVCGRCDGENFRSDVVTICPGCRAFRAESVLLTCPECAFDFSSRRADDEFWVPPQKAIADAALARNVALLQEKAAGFENGLWDGQLQTLLAALRPDEQLFGICRCGLPNQVGRYVALLLTSQQLVWTRQSPMSKVAGGSVAWSDVLAVHAHYGGGSTTDRGVLIEIRNSPPLVFKDFRGSGVSLTAEPASFTVDAVHTIINQLSQPHRPAAAASVIHQPQQFSATVPATPALSTPQPVATPPPGPAWYPDPWRTARLRWWNGTQWTPYLSP
jgi:hypothetical protein